MEFDHGIEQKKPATGRYDFSNVKPGMSLWVKDDNERIKVMRAFGRWREGEATLICATSERVGADDPRGAGYRIHFYTGRNVNLRPVVAAKFPAASTWDETQRAILKFSGIFNDDDYMAAVASVGIAPTTVAEANNIRKMIWTKKTPYQIAFIRAHHAEPQQEPATDAAAMPPVSPRYADLTAAQREALAGRLIFTEADYEAAMRERPLETEDQQRTALHAAMNGYAAITTDRQNAALHAKNMAAMGAGPEEE